MTSRFSVPPLPWVSPPPFEWRLPLVSLLLLLALTACEGGASTDTGNRNTTSDPEAVSPLGLGYPDPGALMQQLFATMESRNFAALCALLAGPGKNPPRPVPLVPGVNVPEIPDDKMDAWPSLEQVRGLREFLRQPWVNVRYGRPRTLRNDPPFIAVPLYVTYDYEAIPANERQLMVRSWSARSGVPTPFEEVAAQMKEREREEARGTREPPEIAFAWVRETWRFYLGPLPQ